MLKSMLASTAILAGAALIASAAGIQAATAAMKLSQAECDTLWNRRHTDPFNTFLFKAVMGDSLGGPFIH